MRSPAAAGSQVQRSPHSAGRGRRSPSAWSSRTTMRVQSRTSTDATARWAVPVAAGVVLAALIGNYRLGPIPGWRHVPGGERFQATAARVTDHDRIAEQALELIPPKAVVSATNTLGAHLSARRRVLSFPFLQEATWIAVDETQPGYADRYAPLPTAVQLAALRRNADWRLVFEEDGILVFRRAPT